MIFENIEKMQEITGKRNNNTKEKVFEFEFYDMIYHLLDCIHSFESGNRKVLLPSDYREMFGEIEHVYKTLRGNIKYLERD